jgi:hypothetical protein
MLSRLAHTYCQSAEVFGLDRVGKKMEWKELVFTMPENVGYKERDKIAYEQALKSVPEGWVVSNYFGSQGTFFVKDGKSFGRATIRRWVEIDNG